MTHLGSRIPVPRNSIPGNLHDRLFLTMLIQGMWLHKDRAELNPISNEIESHGSVQVI